MQQLRNADPRDLRFRLVSFWFMARVMGFVGGS